MTHLSGLMSSKAASRSSVIVSQEGRLFNFDIVKPLSKAMKTETEDLILFIRWLGVFYLLAGGW